MARYLGRNQVGICQRSGKKVRRADLVEDGQVKGLLVAKEWWEPYHPQLLPPPMRADGIPHFKPAPDDVLPPPAPVLTLAPGLVTIITGNVPGADCGYAAPGSDISIGSGTPITAPLGSIVSGGAQPFGTLIGAVVQEGSDFLVILVEGVSAPPAQNAFASVTLKNPSQPYTLTKTSASATYSTSGNVAAWYWSGIGAEPTAGAGETWTLDFGSIGGLIWTQTSNDIGFTDFYVVSSFNPTTGVYTYVTTIYTPDTYSIDAAGSFILTPFPFPVQVSVPPGTILVVQAHGMTGQLFSSGGGYSGYSNQVTA